jgi:hypothetical protein
MFSVSVIIPVFNCIRFISESIGSVLKQTYRDFEIIIVDGGSTDGTLNEIVKFSEKVKLIRSKRGISYQKNIGIKAANGRFIAFLDADDLFLPEKLRLTVEFLEKNPSFGLVYSDSIWCDEKERPVMLSSDEWRPKAGWVFRELLKSCFISTASVVVCRKEVLIKIGLFDVSFVQNEDYDLWLRLSTFYPIGYISSPLVKHRIWQGNVTKKRHEAYFYSLRLIHKVLRYNGTPIYNNVGLGWVMRALLYFKIGHFLYYLQRIKSARRWIIRSIFTNPFCFKPYFFFLLTTFNINPDRYRFLKKRILDFGAYLKH